MFLLMGHFATLGACHNPCSKPQKACWAIVATVLQWRQSGLAQGLGQSAGHR